MISKERQLENSKKQRELEDYKFLSFDNFIYVRESSTNVVQTVDDDDEETFITRYSNDEVDYDDEDDEDSEGSIYRSVCSGSWQFPQGSISDNKSRRAKKSLTKFPSSKF